MGISNDIAGYLKSLIPVNRGKVQKLKDCFEGENKVPILISEFNKYPGMKEATLALEGLITNRGVHAAGTIVCNRPYTNYIATIRSPDGVLETSYDLWDSEEAGCIKFDMLTVEAADKIHKTMDFLIQNNHIEWQGSLKATYYKYLHPDVLEYDNPDMWKIVTSIYSLFQWDTPTSVKAIQTVKPQSLMELSTANSLLRLMPEGSGELPIDKFVRYKQDFNEWYKDTASYGLNKEEQDCLLEHLKDSYGLADSQEKIMRLSMDKRISGYSLKEANKLRKSIAKKDEKLQAEAKIQFFEYGRKLGTRDVFLDYVWNVVFSMSLGYSFSQIHSYVYSIIALQELNLNYFYPKVYWNCACLSIEAIGLKDNENGTDKMSSTDYGEIAKAIYKTKQSKIEVNPPSINNSEDDFTPKEKDNTILFGLAAISGINKEIAQQIINNRPYTSFQDFFRKNFYQGSLITNSKFIQLIKSGCFDEFNSDRLQVMKEYIELSTPKKETISLANIAEAIKIGANFPKKLINQYKFKKYVCSKQFYNGPHPQFKSKKLYWLNEKSKNYFNKNCLNYLEEGKDYFYKNDLILVVDKSLEKLYHTSMEQLKQYMKSPEFIKDYNDKLLKAKLNETVSSFDTNKWMFEACSFYDKEHELAGVNKEKYLISYFDELPEIPQFITRKSGNREWKQMELYQIAGTVLGRIDSHNIVTILDMNNNVVSCKLSLQDFANYKRQISISENGEKETVVDPSWLKRGQTLILTGARVGETDFKVKTYKNSIFKYKIQKIDSIDSSGDLQITSQRWDEYE